MSNICKLCPTLLIVYLQVANPKCYLLLLFQKQLSPFNPTLHGFQQQVEFVMYGREYEWYSHIHASYLSSPHMWLWIPLPFPQPTHMGRNIYLSPSWETLYRYINHILQTYLQFWVVKYEQQGYNSFLSKTFTSPVEGRLRWRVAGPLWPQQQLPCCTHSPGWSWGRPAQTGPPLAWPPPGWAASHRTGTGCGGGGRGTAVWWRGRCRGGAPPPCPSPERSESTRARPTGWSGKCRAAGQEPLLKKCIVNKRYCFHGCIINLNQEFKWACVPHRCSSNTFSLRSEIP